MYLFIFIFVQTANNEFMKQCWFANCTLSSTGTNKARASSGTKPSGSALDKSVPLPLLSYRVKITVIPIYQVTVRIKYMLVL
jgi:hypothetical protein